MFLAMEPRNILGGANFFKKKCLSKFFVAKMKTLVIMAQKLLHSLYICLQENRKLRPKLLLYFSMLSTFCRIIFVIASCKRMIN